MKIKITLRDFLDTCCNNNRVFIRVFHSQYNQKTDKNEDVWIIPPITPWHYCDDESVNERIKRLAAEGRLKDEFKALVFTDDKFNIDEIYGEYTEWNVNNLYPNIFNNAIAHMFDEVLDIHISKATSIRKE